ncbi:MAG: efflux RND transporter permease subunit [Novosphingobium sp.]
MITRFAIRHWQFMTAVAVAILMIGINTFLSIPKSVDPHFPAPVVVTTVFSTGTNTLDMEQTVTKPIESAISGLDDIRTITSVTRDGIAIITTYFEHGTNPDQSLDKISRELSALRAVLPASIERIDFRRPRNTEAAAMQLALVSDDASWLRLEKYADDAKDRLSALPGVRSVSIDGLPSQEMSVVLQPEKLWEHSVSSAEVAAAIGRYGTETGQGEIASGDSRFSIEGGGILRSPEQISAIPLRSGSGGAVLVGDVAKVIRGEAQHDYRTRFNGQRGLFIVIKQKEGFDSQRVHREVTKALAEIRAELPPDMKLAVGFDQVRDIDSRMGELARDFLIALALVLFTISPLGLRASLIVMVSIPLSLGIGMYAVSLFGFTLNQISIAGFIISLGLLVDDAIVVVENINRKIRSGMAPLAAAIDGTNEIFRSIVGATVLIVLVFLPLALLPELSGDFIRAMPVAIIFTVIGSLFVALTIVPFAASKLLTGSGQENRILHSLDRLTRNIYAPVLRYALARPRSSLAIAAVLCLSALALVPLLQGSLFPPSDTPRFLVRIEGPESASVDRMDTIISDVARRIARLPEVENVMENVGRNNAQVFYNSIPADRKSNYGEVFVTIKPGEEKATARVVGQLRAQFAAYPEAKITAEVFNNGPPIEAPVAIRVRGDNLEELGFWADQVAAAMRQVPGTRNVDNPFLTKSVSSELHLDEDRARTYGISLAAARDAVRLALQGQIVAQFRDVDGDNYPVVVRYANGREHDFDTLRDVLVPSGSANLVPLSNLMTMELNSVPVSIQRYDQRRTITVTSQVAPGYATPEVAKNAFAQVSALHLPPGIDVAIGGEAEAAARDFGNFQTTVLLILSAMTAVLILEFGDLRTAGIVLCIIPLGLFGGLCGVFLSGSPLSFMAIVGMIALLGIEMKNSILLVDFAQQELARGTPILEAVELAGEIRFMPVLLTSATAIGGLLPLAFSGIELYQPLAWAIIGGLVSSTVLSRIVTPVLCLFVLKTPNISTTA